MNTCCGPDRCGLPEAELVAEIEDCIGDDCGGGSGLPWPIPPAPPEDPSDPTQPCETCELGMISNTSNNEIDKSCIPYYFTPLAFYFGMIYNTTHGTVSNCLGH